MNILKERGCMYVPGKEDWRDFMLKPIWHGEKATCYLEVYNIYNVFWNAIW